MWRRLTPGIYLTTRPVRSRKGSPLEDLRLISTDSEVVTKHSHELNSAVIVAKQVLITLCRPEKSIFRRNQAEGDLHGESSP